MKLRGTLIGGIALAGTILAVPGDGARAQTEQTILALPAVSLSFLVEFVAEDSHLWEKQGLGVKVVTIAGIGAINAVISNSADFSMSSGPSIARAHARGQKLVALATAIDQSGPNV